MSDEDPWGDEETCPNNENGHEPDWDKVTTESDGGEWYIDIRCKHCNRSGCVGTEKTLVEGISW